MGGSVLIINGKMDEEKLSPKPIKKNLIDILFRRQRYSNVKKYAAGGDREITELPVDGLKGLSDHFTSFIAKQFAEPNESTRSFIDYLKIGAITIHVRGESGINAIAPDWYIQFTFSGCAGMAEVSAELGAHWAKSWYEKTNEELTENYFKPFGFTPTGMLDESMQSIFVPVRSFGYALLNKKPYDEGYIGSRYLEFDQAYLESAGDEEIKKLSQIDSFVEKDLLNGGCHCQFCDPSFKELRVGE
jgi:hypothetical protein